MPTRSNVSARIPTALTAAAILLALGACGRARDGSLPGDRAGGAGTIVAASTTPAVGTAAAGAAANPAPGRGDMSDYSKPSQEELRKRLTPLQYRVTKKEGTEPSFRNEYWDNHEPGIYVDVVSGEPLFSSLDKFE